MITTDQSVFVVTACKMNVRITINDLGLKPTHEAVVDVLLNGKKDRFVAEGDSELEALNNALCRASGNPLLLKISDHAVNICNDIPNKKPLVRVFIWLHDGKTKWPVTAESTSITGAFLSALLDGFRKALADS